MVTYYDEEMFIIPDGWLKEHNEKLKHDTIDKYSHELKETFNQEFPTNYHATKPYFTLDNVRILTDLVAKEMIESD